MATALALAAVVATPPMPRAWAAVSFHDSFDGRFTWSVFEEVVGGNACYGTGVAAVRSADDVAVTGPKSLQVTANAAVSTKSNHPIAHRTVSGVPVSGRAVYQVWARQEPLRPASAGETGPELSVHSTRQAAAGQFMTTVAGVQYLTNPQSPANGTWAVWRDNGGTAGWHLMLTQPTQRARGTS